MKGWRKKLLVSLLVLFSLAIGLFFTNYVYSNTQLGKVVAIADKFTPPNDWKLVKETKNKPVIISGCIPHECPSITREYVANVGSVGSKEVFKKYLANNLPSTLNNISCSESNSYDSKDYFCISSSKEDRFTLSMSADINGDKGVADIRLSVSGDK